MSQRGGEVDKKGRKFGEFFCPGKLPSGEQRGFAYACPCIGWKNRIPPSCARNWEGVMASYVRPFLSRPITPIASLPGGGIQFYPYNGTSLAVSA